MIDLDPIEREMNTCTSGKVYVFTDKSYMKKNHAHKNGHTPKDPNIDSKLNRKSGKCTRLVILHSITKDGPLAEMDDETCIPVDDLKWTGDTPHPGARNDNKVTAELLWGDYVQINFNIDE